jgi:hypothetical protein
MIWPVSVLSNERGGFRSETQAPASVIVVSDEKYDMTVIYLPRFSSFLSSSPRYRVTVFGA